MKIIENTPFSVFSLRLRGDALEGALLCIPAIIALSCLLSGVHQLFCKKGCCVIICRFCPLLHFPPHPLPVPFFRISVLIRTARKKEKSTMIEAKASRTRERKETVFNEKKTVRDFGRSDAGQQLRHECDGGRICTGTVHGLRSGESNHHGHAGTDIPRRNWGISMASPPFWKWMGSSSRT